ncbi:MAG: methyltransferase domain-containing protein [Bryobacteraceae bacterium]
MTQPPVPSGSASVQAPLWGARVSDWAEIQEPTARPLFEAILAATGVGPGVAMLDVGCGAGLFCQLAANAGASVSGFDAAEPMISVARARVPGGDFRIGDMEELPFADNSFDLVTGVNSFQYAANPVRALAEASRVVKTRGTLVIATWGRREDCETGAYLDALRALLPSSSAGASSSFALSSRSALEAVIREAGLHPESFQEVDSPIEYPNLETALRGLLSTGPAVRAIERSGEKKVVEAVTNALAPYRRTDGAYRMANKFMFLVASRTPVKNYFRPGFRSVTPYLVVADAAALIDFLKSAFGAHEMLRVPGANGGVMHAELQIGDSIIEVGQASEAWKAGPASLHLYVPDADATYRRALAAGGVSLQEPHDTNYGDRSSGVQDPAGNRWFIATHVGGK